MGLATSYIIENDRAFAAALDRSARASKDLRIPLTIISKDFYRSQKAIWQLKSPGQYPDLAASTKADRKRRGQSIYPIMIRTGRLKKSLTEPNALDSINEIVNKTALIIGSKVPYLAPHQDGAPKVNLPMRKVLFIGPEAPRFATRLQQGRLERWNNILNSYVLEVSGKQLDGVK